MAEKREKCVFVFSGKRKSGKDYVVTKFSELLGANKCDVIRLSAPLKRQYASENGLNFDQLLDSSSYKERYRKDMIEWGEAKRKIDPAFFCNLATENASKPIWIISDARRTTDLNYFRTNFPRTLHARVTASEITRRARGWEFVHGIDDAQSECDLDSEKWDILINNDGNSQNLEQCLQQLMQNVESV